MEFRGQLTNWASVKGLGVEAQARSQDFSWGVHTSINIEVIGHANFEDTRFLLGGGGSGGKIWNLKLLKMPGNCQFYHHHVILYHLKSFTIPSGRPFWLLGGWGGGASDPAHPSAYWPEAQRAKPAMAPKWNFSTHSAVTGPVICLAISAEVVNLAYFRLSARFKLSYIITNAKICRNSGYFNLDMVWRVALWNTRRVFSFVAWIGIFSTIACIHQLFSIIFSILILFVVWYHYH